ncbi:hypothetical protein UPYG_G00331580 [Umbra pygmaea]|uniref:Secreted protein n=1 Tax=Umbra pygmaea TaxID=75934 RepID=A0ABD0VZS0_UMBPY
MRQLHRMAHSLGVPAGLVVLVLQLSSRLGSASPPHVCATFYTSLTGIENERCPSQHIHYLCFGLHVSRKIFIQWV